MKQLSRTYRWLPEIYLFMITVYYWISNEVFLEPYVLSVLVLFIYFLRSKRSFLGMALGLFFFVMSLIKLYYAFIDYQALVALDAAYARQYISMIAFIYCSSTFMAGLMSVKYFKKLFYRSPYLKASI